MPAFSSAYRSTSARSICDHTVPSMDPDYITDLVEENGALQSRLVEMKEGWRSQVAELEEELRQLKDDLRRALHRKVEEVSTPSDRKSVV